jgi:regulator of sirC expression with transglutaminase-like and TPR domain
MEQTKEINALFTLIDDPDEEIYSSISEKIVAYGIGIVPNLEHLWETTLSEDVQQRIEGIIQRLHFTDLLTDMTAWKNTVPQDLLSGALLVGKLEYPDINNTAALQDLEKIRKNIWLELNSFLTPLEQANVLTSILFKYYKLFGNEVDYKNQDDFFVHKVLETKQGNAMSNGIIYQTLCEQLDIHAKIINIPKQCILAFYHSDYEEAHYIGNPQDKIHFYIDATNGNAFSHADIDSYFDRINITPKPTHFKAQSPANTLCVLLTELNKCYGRNSKAHKQLEIAQLMALLEVKS